MRKRSPFLPEEDSASHPPSPWGFRIVVMMTAIYLLYRLGQGIGWLINRF